MPQNRSGKSSKFGIETANTQFYSKSNSFIIIGDGFAIDYSVHYQAVSYTENRNLHSLVRYKKIRKNTEEWSQLPTKCNKQRVKNSFKYVEIGGTYVSIRWWSISHHKETFFYLFLGVSYYPETEHYNLQIRVSSGNLVNDSTQHYLFLVAPFY